MSIFQVISLKLSNSGNLSFIIPYLFVLYTPTTMEYLDFDFFIYLHKFKQFLDILVFLHLVSYSNIFFIFISFLVTLDGT